MTRRSAPFDYNAVMQRDPHDSGYVQTRRRHALDEGPRDLDAAYRHLYGAMDHLHAARAGKIDFDSAIYNDHVTKAADCLKGGGQDEAEEEAEDDVGEVPARSTVETTGSGDPDRESSSGGKLQGGGRWGGASSIQGAADSALTDYSFDEMMQRN